MSFVYNLVFKRTSTFVVGIAASVFFFDRGFNVAADAFFDNHNKGKLWNDIKHKYDK